MATFGEFPGVRVTVTGGGISAIEIGAEEKVVLFGESGDGDADPNDPVQVRSRRDGQRLFGADTELHDGVRGALANGANREFVYGVSVDTVTAQTESFSASDSGTLENAPVSEGTVESGTLDIVYRYEDDLSIPTEVDTVYVNPHTGEWTAFESGDYDFDYEYADWDAAFNAADDVVRENESAIYAALTESESVGQSLSGKVQELRQDYKMVKGLVAAEPNATEEGAAHYDIDTFSHNYDSDSFFVTAPARREGTKQTVLGGVSGLFAGNDITEPIYNDPLNGYTSLEQRITRSEGNALRDQNIIPIKEMSSIRVADNTSTSSETDWSRDFWRRRIVDRVILLSKEVGDATVGRINDEDTREVAETTLKNEIEGLVQDRLIEPNETDMDENWYVDVTQDPTDPDQVRIDVGITPTGVVKRVDVTVEIDT